jgi:hypothetical protein
MSGGQRLCIEHSQIRDEAAALAAAQARLTVEKFLELAAAAGNPGLETWTIEKKGQVTYTDKVGFIKVAKSRWGVVEETSLPFGECIRGMTQNITRAFIFYSRMAK